MKPIGERVIVKNIDDKKSKIALPPTASKEERMEGIVTEVGKDIKDIKKGDRIIFIKHSAYDIKIEDKKYKVVNYEDILVLI